MSLTKGTPITHGFLTALSSVTQKRFYKIWQNINARCYLKENKNYKNYGGRGIKCLWKTFEQFRDDMYESYLAHIKEFGLGAKNTTVERKNSNEHYCKKNCRWATMKEQVNNRSNTLFVKIGNKTKTVSEWCDIFGIKLTRKTHSKIYARIKKLGWTTEKIFTKP